MTEQTKGPQTGTREDPAASAEGARGEAQRGKPDGKDAGSADTSAETQADEKK